MKAMFNEFFGNEWRFFKRLRLKHKFYVLYFLLSFCALCVGDETPVWIVALIVLNFGNSVRLIKRVPLKLKEG